MRELLGIFLFVSGKKKKKIRRTRNGSRGGTSRQCSHCGCMERAAPEGQRHQETGILVNPV